MSGSVAAGGLTAPAAPSKRDLVSWWKQFFGAPKKEEAPRPVGIFGVALEDSIKYAHIAISITEANGNSVVYGYVPIVVAKCGSYLKENATNIEGIFRLSGSAKRVRELREAFDSPPKYGRGLDFSGFTCHDVANLLRRYLIQLPDPIIPHQSYHHFRHPLKGYEIQAVGEARCPPDIGSFDHAKTIRTYQDLIGNLEQCNRTLLLYILDLLTVFSSKSDQNRMTSSNLSAIFQPCLLTHPQHDMAPDEYRLNQNVLVFLIENQDHFLMGLPSTPKAARPSGSKSTIKRSASNASSGADNLRKYEVSALRRNISLSSQNSKKTAGSSSAATTTSATIRRSNTVPANRLATNTVTTNRSTNGTIPATESTSTVPAKGPTGTVPATESTGDVPVSDSPSSLAPEFPGVFPVAGSADAPAIESAATPLVTEAPNAVPAGASAITATVTKPIDSKSVPESAVATPVPETTVSPRVSELVDLRTLNKPTVVSRSPVRPIEQNPRAVRSISPVGATASPAAATEPSAEVKAASDEKSKVTEQSVGTSPKERKLTSLFGRSTHSPRPDSKQPNRLRKKRTGEISMDRARSSTTSFQLSHGSQTTLPNESTPKHAVTGSHASTPSQSSDSDHDCGGEIKRGRSYRRSWIFSRSSSKNPPSRSPMAPGSHFAGGINNTSDASGAPGAPAPQSRPSQPQTSQPIPDSTPTNDTSNDTSDQDKLGLFGRVKAKLRDRTLSPRSRSRTPSPSRAIPLNDDTIDQGSSSLHPPQLDTPVSHSSSCRSSSSKPPSPFHLPIPEEEEAVSSELEPVERDVADPTPNKPGALSGTLEAKATEPAKSEPAEPRASEPKPTESKPAT